jgi:hypothetical protein
MGLERLCGTSKQGDCDYRQDKELGYSSFFSRRHVFCGSGRQAEAQLRCSYPPKKAPIRVRLVAIAISLARSSFFKSTEVFIAETEISHEEWGLIKLVFTFLPYEPRLSQLIIRWFTRSQPGEIRIAMRLSRS